LRSSKEGPCAAKNTIEPVSETAVRVDKWLWAARFFKTRSAAQQAIEGGKVKLNGERTKPAKDLKAGDRLAINIRGYEWEIEVVQLSSQRGPAPVARTLYTESEESRAKRALEVDKRRRFNEPATALQGRPTKRDRRMLERWREDGNDEC
jgi:ribosome-associated heat shock protein Hsp15